MDASCYVNAEWVATDRRFDVTNPATGDVVGSASDAGPDVATRAIDAAHDAFPEWSATTAVERAAAMRRISAALLDNKDEMAELIASQRHRYAAAPEVATEAVSTGETSVADGVDVVELAALMSVTRSVFNMHEFITRN